MYESRSTGLARVTSTCAPSSMVSVRDSVCVDVCVCAPHERRKNFKKQLSTSKR